MIKTTEPQIVAHTCKLPEHGREWNPVQVERTTYWVEGGGFNRPATDAEVSIYRQTVERALKVVKPFTEYVNVTKIGMDPETALRKEFGL